MIYTVTINPTLDYTLVVPNLVLGRTNRPTQMFFVPGGKGILESIVFRNLGHYNTALGFLAGFVGKEIRRDLLERKVNIDFIELPSGNSRICVQIRSEQETKVNGFGPEIGDMHLKLLEDKLHQLEPGDYLSFAGTVPASLPQTFYADMMKSLKGKGINIIVDAVGDLLMNTLPEHPFLLKPNNHELGDIFGVTIESKEDAIKYAYLLKEKGAVNVLVSMGGSGAVLVDEFGNSYQSNSPKGKLVNSLGAGDSMVAGFIAGYIEREDYEFAFHKGVCTGSATAFSEGFATLESVEALMRDTFPQHYQE